MNDTTFQGNGKIAYVPVVVNAKPPKTTNYDRIRAMSAEELAEFESERMCCPPGKPGCEANNLTCDNCEKCWLDWLKQEIDSET